MNGCSQQVIHGVQADADPHLVGPWDNTELDRRLNRQNLEGFATPEDN